MNKTQKFFGAICLSTTLLTPAVVFADEQHDHTSKVSDAFKAEAMELRDEHYHVDAPETKEAADALLKETLEKVKEYYAKGAFEEIHKDSYALEAVVDSFRAKEAHQASHIDALDEAVQIIHYASEQEDENVIKTAMPSLEKAANAILEN